MVHIDARPYRWPYQGGLNSTSTALLIIDMQRDFCEVGGYASSMGYDVSNASELVPRIVQLRAQFRAWGGLVIYTREGHRPDLSDLPQQKLLRSRGAGGEIGSVGPLGRLLVRGEPGWDIVPQLVPSPGEPTVDKPGYGAFYATDLARIVAARNIRHLVICGVTTDVCVHSTLREAVDRGLEPLLVTDCCAATAKSNHDAAIETICSEGGIFGAVATSTAVITALEGTRHS
ncbi:cysteine hydrolase [Bradyrhizobium sp. 24]|uniref:cysteine hydrolase family protein n=1 Tax=unclassified Bradyrhizobium TaxID=2631580 RepID=UPI001FF79E8E|nr:MULTISPECIES: isochorismatase family cysteine hydrolase [unclassified Bradyrhizobium]MCK1298413.1 cysteine hydrolase [Bradyrhizobium sp. 37]MCK1378226.1 cysteine hydrolase [Bradyrhizobium sp. 24]MCK1769456.1 cysteine hydrolase [Bradyrhizobium sp. 134]